MVFQLLLYVCASLLYASYESAFCFPHVRFVLLIAIPQRELRWFQPPTPPGMPGLRVQPTAPPPVWGEFYAPGVEQQFPDNDALEYLEEIRNVVLAQNPDRDPRTLQFLLDEYDAYFAKRPPPYPTSSTPSSSSSENGTNAPATLSWSSTHKRTTHTLISQAC